MRTAFLLLLTIATPAAAIAQPQAESVYVDAARAQFGFINDLVMRSAEKVGEELYSFKPTPDVRSFAGVLGHIADANVMLCRVGAGETTIADVMKNIAAIQVHEKKSGKAELIAALKDARALCEKHFATVTDASGREPVAWFGGMQMPKLQVLQQATSHAWEHYGNLVTYMRLKGIVPPSSERQPSR